MFGVEPKSSLLKYERIIEELKEAIRQKKFRIGQGVPSITRVSQELGCSRETVVKAYDVLKKEGVLDSHPGKGFFVASEKIANCPKVFLLLNNLTPYMEVLYNAFVGALEDKAVVDVFFHHNRIEMFEKLIRDNSRKYFSYIVKPFAHKRVDAVLGMLPQNELLVLDRREGINDARSFISQDFRDDFYFSLNNGAEDFAKYREVQLVFSRRLVHPEVCVEAFERFVRERKLHGRVVERVGPHDVSEGVAYITLTDEDLVAVLRGCRDKGCRPGRGVGVISYNDTPLKEFVGDGVTVVSADFAQMGRLAADFAVTRKPVQYTMQATLIRRASL